MADDKTTLDPQMLEQAFALFSQASAELTGSWQQLQHQVAQLTTELAVANGELRRQFEEKRALSQRLEQLLDALPGGVVVLDDAGTVQQANPAARQWLGETLAGMPWSGVVSERLTATELDHEWLTGEGRRVTLTARPLGEAAGQILLIHDLTDMHAMQRELERHRRLSAMGEMAAALAHQLRTPLATALLYASHLGRADLPDADRQRFADRTLARLRHLESLIQDMLQFVRGEAAVTTATELRRLVNEIAQVMEPQMQTRGLLFKVAAGADDLTVLANREALAGAVINLLTNAMQACAADSTVHLTLASEATQVRLSVRDNGPGVPAAVQARLFEPFFTTRSDGTGLGLAIVRQVVTAHKGTIEVISTEGEGCEFVIRLPLAPASTGGTA